MNKSKIKQKLIEIQEQIINDLKERVNAHYELVDLDDNDTLDPEDYSHQNEASDMEQLLSQQLEKAKQDLVKINSIDFSNKTKIELGSVVQTNNFSFIIGVSTLPFQIDNKNYIGISTNAPIYSTMIGKKENETFSYSNNSYHIVAIN